MNNLECKQGLKVTCLKLRQSQNKGLIEIFEFSHFIKYGHQDDIIQLVLELVLEFHVCTLNKSAHTKKV